MRDKNKALVMIIACVVIGFSLPFLNSYIEQEAVNRNIEISSLGLIPWQFVMLLCGIGVFIGLFFYIHFDSEEKKKRKNPGMME